MHPLTVSLLVGVAHGFPWVSDLPGVDSSLFRRAALEPRMPGDAVSLADLKKDVSLY